MKEVKVTVKPDGTFKIEAEGAAGFAALDLKAALEKIGVVTERHVGVHPHGHGHKEGGEHVRA